MNMNHIYKIVILIYIETVIRSKDEFKDLRNVSVSLKRIFRNQFTYIFHHETSSLINWTGEVSGGGLRLSFLSSLLTPANVYISTTDEERFRTESQLICWPVQGDFFPIFSAHSCFFQSEIESRIVSVVGNESVIGVLRKGILRIESFESHAREVSKAMVIICLFYWC